MSAGGQDWADPPPWTGPWADDARRLFQLLQTAVDHAGSPSGAGESADSAERPGYEHPPECRYCPFCQGVVLLRRAGPDVLDQVSEFAAGLAATLRATQPPAADPEDAPTGAFDGSADDRTNARPRPPSTVRIDVTD
jgi:hypothetical protein